MQVPEKTNFNQHDIDIAVIKEKMSGDEKAKLLQDKLNEIHFEKLNQENARIKDIENKFPIKEVVDSRFSEVFGKIQVMLDYVTAERSKADLQKWVPWIIAAAALAWSIFKK